MKIFYHIDNDGKCAGYLVYKKFKEKYSCECIPINYGMNFPFDKIDENEHVWIVDYSIEPNEMDRLFEITENVVWIDHHITAINKYKEYNKKIPGVRLDGFAGCMLTYCYLEEHEHDNYMVEANSVYNVTYENAPLVVKLVEDYDIWKFKYGNDTRFFKLGLDLYNTDPTSREWQILYNNYLWGAIDIVIKKGQIVDTYRKNMMKEYCEKKGFECELITCDSMKDISQYKCFAVNMANMNSDDFVGININEYDLLIGFSFNGEIWSYSLRCGRRSNIDCSYIASLFGGGGHPGAAGFSSEKLLLRRVKNMDE